MIQLPDELNLIVSLALLALIPFIAMMATSFVKLAVVFSLLRNALGVQQIPPNMALYGLAIILSIFIMAPVGFETYDYVKQHDISLEDSASVEGLIESGLQPYREFLKKHIRETEAIFFYRRSTHAVATKIRGPFGIRQLIAVAACIYGQRVNAGF